MKQVLTIALVCALLIAAQSAAVSVKVECKANDACEGSKTEWIYTQGNATQTVCSKQACDVGTFTADYWACENDFAGTACSAKYCLGDFSTCLDDAKACDATDSDNAVGSVTTDCAECSANDKCTDDTTAKGQCTTTGGTESCFSQTIACPYTKVVAKTENCDKDGSGAACKCCGGYTFTGLKDSGICLKDMPFYTDEFEKAFKG